MKSLLGLLLLTSSCAVTAQIYPPRLFALTPTRIDSAREARPSEWYLEGRSEQSLVRSLAEFMEIDPEYMTLAKSTMFRNDRDGEALRVNVATPRGYSYCGARVRVTSVVPSEGPRASQLRVFANPEGILIETWASLSSMGSGRSWVEADIQLISIRTEFIREFVSNGICVLPSESAILTCIGKQCEQNASNADFEAVGRKVPRLRRGPVGR